MFDKRGDRKGIITELMNLLEAGVTEQNDGGVDNLTYIRREQRHEYTKTWKDFSRFYASDRRHGTRCANVDVGTVSNFLCRDALKIVAARYHWASRNFVGTVESSCGRLSPEIIRFSTMPR